MSKFCANCGKELEENASFCPNCGTPTNPEDVTESTFVGNGNSSYNNTSFNQTANMPEQKSKIAAGLLGLFFGSWGVHNFYLGYTNKAILQIVLTIFTCGIAGIWGFIEGILILAGSINVDANGVPLKD